MSDSQYLMLLAQNYDAIKEFLQKALETRPYNAPFEFVHEHRIPRLKTDSIGFGITSSNIDIAFAEGIVKAIKGKDTIAKDTDEYTR